MLFRGNAEAEIRRNLIRKGFIKGIIGLPANLFYGTGIPACILVIDKEDAHNRKGIFMVDASDGFIKDGNKNRLRNRDLHKIVDVFNSREVIKGYSRMVSFDEIEDNEWNLNIPRYIDSQEAEDIQDISGHLQGGIPSTDIDALESYWDVCPKLKSHLFSANRKGYMDLSAEKQNIKSAIYDHPEFSTFIKGMAEHYQTWQSARATEFKKLEPGFKPKQLITQVAERLLGHYEGQALIDHYAVYQHLMDYWDETMQDDAYLIAADGWKAETSRVIVKNKAGKPQDKGWTCDLVPKGLIVSRYFADEQAAIDAQQAELEAKNSAQDELEEEHGGEDGAFAELEKINKAEVTKRLKEIKAELETCGRASASASPLIDEEKVLKQWQTIYNQISKLKKAIKDAEAALDTLAYEKYPTLSEDEVKTLVVDDKWLATLNAEIHGEMDRISQSLTQRVKELAERYEDTLPALTDKVADMESKVSQHLERMGFSWK